MIDSGKFGGRKRNFRRQLLDSAEKASEENPASAENICPPPAPPASETQPLKPNPTPRTQLTFQDLAGSDDEEFVEPIKLKRSSHSRKMARESLISHKHKSTRDLAVPVPMCESSIATGSLEVSSPPSGSEPSQAENNGDDLYKLRSTVQIGVIPDATTIHLAKKQREIARRRQEQDADVSLPTFIPMNQRTTKSIEDTSVQKPLHASRLIREDIDADISEEEESLLPVQMLDRAKRSKSVVRRTVLHHESSSDEDEEVKRWEEEQMMKGVTVRAVVDEYVDSTRHSGEHISSRGEAKDLVYGDTATTYQYSRAEMRSNYQIEYPRIEDPWKVENGGTSSTNTSVSISEVTVQSILLSVRREHDKLDETVTFQQMECDRNSESIRATEESFQNSKKKIERDKENYKLFREIGDYIGDLLECIGEKQAIIERIESQIFAIRADIAQKLLDHKKLVLAERDRLSRQDITITIAQSSYPSRVEADLLTVEEKKGFDEINASNEKKKAEILKEAENLFSDTLEEFSSLELVLNRFENWRLTHEESYQQSYIPLFLSKLLAIYARLELLKWDPLTSEGLDWKLQKWYISLFPISNSSNNLLPTLLEHSLIPLLTEAVKTAWDPMSSTQTRRLALSVMQINHDFPSLASKKPMQTLYQTVSKTLLTSTQALYMPMFSKDHLEKNSEAKSLLCYQFCLGVQLGANVSLWTGILPEPTLRELILDGLLNRYLTLALHQFTDYSACVERCSQLVELLPDSVKRGGHDSEVVALVRYMCWLVEALDRESMTGPDFIKKRAREGKTEMIGLIRCLASEQASHLQHQFIKK